MLVVLYYRMLVVVQLYVLYDYRVTIWWRATFAYVIELYRLLVRCLKCPSQACHIHQSHPQDSTAPNSDGPYNDVRAR
jgi:hypothetical protein